ncbi:hypothetical protein DYB25_008383, partial [Aphanomyces astaci]
MLSWLPSVNPQGSSVSKYLLEWYEASSPGTQAVQVLKIFDTLNAQAVTGSFKLTYSQCTTDFLAVDVSAADLTDALNSMPCLRSVQVVRSGLMSGGYQWSITFLTESPNGVVLAVGANDLASPNLAFDVGASLDPAHVGASSVTAGVTLASTTVTSVGIQTSAVPGMFLQIAGVVYKVATVATNQVTLSTPYVGATSASVTAVLGTTVPGVTSPTLQSVEIPTDTNATAPFYYHISNLRPGVTYIARVSCYNSRGYNVPTASQPTAPPQQPPSRPLQVKVVTSSASTLSVYWSHPQSDGGNAISKYRVEWDVSAAFNSGVDGGSLGSDIVSVVVPGVDCVLTPCQSIVGSLVKGTPYFVRIYAYNRYGYSSDAGVPSPLSTIPQTFPMPPTLVQLAPGDNASLSVAFSTQHDNGGAPVTKYKIEWDCMDQHAIAGTPNLVTTDLLYVRQAVQRILVSATAFDLGGTFRLGFAGAVTPWLNYDTSATLMQQTLEALDTIGAVRVQRNTVGNGFEWLVTFLTNRENLNHNGDIPVLVASILPTEHYATFDVAKSTGAGATLTGTTAAIQISTNVGGYNGFEEQSVVVATNAGSLQGTFTLTFDGQTTLPLASDAAALSVKSALEALGNSGTVWVTRFASGLGISWNIMFLTRLGSVPLVVVGSNGLYSSDPTATVSVNILEVPGRLPAMSSALYGSQIISVSPSAASQTQIQYNIPSLVVGAYYFVRVSAWNGFQNAFGSAQYSTPPIEAPQLPPGPPQNLVVEANSTSSLAVSWTPPLFDGGSIVQGYTVEWDATPGTYEVQVVVVNATAPITGYFAMTFRNYRSTNLQWDASADMVADALNMLPSVAGVTVSRSALVSFGYSWTVTFQANPGNLPLLGVQTSNLVGSGVAALVVETVTGSNPPFNPLTKGSMVVGSQSEVQEVFAYAGAADLGGTFNLVFSSESSVDIPFDASADVMMKALQGVSTISSVTVTTSNEVKSSILARQEYGRKWRITFTSSDGNVPLLLATTMAGAIPRRISCGGSLTGTTPCVSIRQVTPGGIPLEFIIPQLRTGTPYFVRVQTQTRFGSSAFQLNAFYVAPALVAPLPVRRARVSILSNTQLGVVWDAPPDATVANYKLQWDVSPSFGMTTTTSGSATIQVVAQQTRYTYVIPGLLAANAYFVRVLTYNAGGFSDPTTAVPFYANQRVTRVVVSHANIDGILAAALQTFTLTFANFAPSTVSIPLNARADQVQAALQALVHVGTVFVTRSDHSTGPLLAMVDTSGVDTNGFRIEWFITFAASSVDNIAPTSLGALSVTVSAGIVAAGDFNIADVVAGIDPLPLSITPRATAPDVPLAVTVTVVSSTTLGVQWQAPQYATGITKYLIEWDLDYQIMSPIQIGNSFTNAHLFSAVVTGATTSFLIPGLTTGSTYYIRVSAYNGQIAASAKGYGSAVVATGSPIVPLPQIPYKPTSVAVTVSPLNIATQLDVSWKEPTLNALGFSQGNGGSPITSYTIDVSTQAQFATFQSYPVSTYDAAGVVQSCATTACHFPLGIEVQTVVVAATAGTFQLVHTSTYPTVLCASCTVTLNPVLNQITYNGPDLRLQLGTNVKFVVDKAGAACAFTVAAVATSAANVVTVLPGYTCALTAGTFTMHAQPTTTCLATASLTSTALQTALTVLTNIDAVVVTMEPGPAVGATLYRITFTGALVTGNVPQLQVASIDGSGGCAAITGAVWTGTSIEGGYLSPGGLYFVRVSAGNAVGTGLPQVASPTLCPGGCASDNTIFPVARPPAPTSVLVFAKPTDRSILRLTWNPPATTNGAAVLSYLIEYSVDSFATTDVCGACVTALASNVLTINTQVTTLQVGDLFRLERPVPCIMVVAGAPTWTGTAGTVPVQPNHGCLGFTSQTVFMTDLHGPGSGFVQVQVNSLTSPYSVEVTVVPNTAYTVQMRAANIIGVGVAAAATPTCDNTLVACVASPGLNVIITRQLPSAPLVVLPMQLVSGTGNANGFTQNTLDVLVRDGAYWHGLEAVDSFLVEWDTASTFDSANKGSVTLLSTGTTSRYSLTPICPTCVTSLHTNTLTVSTSTAGLFVGRRYTIAAGTLNCVVQVATITSATQVAVQPGYTCLDFTSQTFSLAENDWISTTLPALLMGSQYFIRATAHNSLGMGTVSAFQTITPAVTSDPPTQVQLAALDSSALPIDRTTSLVVSWMPPNTALSTDLNGNGGVPITGYLVEWSTVDWSSFTSTVQTITTTSSGGVLSGSFQLQLDTTACALCKVKSLAVSSAIAADVSVAALTQILQNMPNIGQVSVTTTGLSGNNEQTWSVTFGSDVGTVPTLTVATNALTALNGVGTIAIVKTNGNLNGNSYCNANVCNSVTVSASTVYPIRNTIAGLVAGTAYFVRVSAFTALGYGLLRLTAPNNLMVPFGLPASPASFYNLAAPPVLYVTGPTSLLVSFQPAAFTGGAPIISCT